MSDSKASNHERVVNVEIEAEGVRKLPESLGASVKVIFESPTLLKDFPAPAGSCVININLHVTS
jgi:hypothetical protein